MVSICELDSWNKLQRESPSEFLLNVLVKSRVTRSLYKVTEEIRVTPSCTNNKYAFIHEAWQGNIIFRTLCSTHDTPMHISQLCKVKMGFLL